MPDLAARVIFAVVAAGAAVALLRVYVQRRFFYPSRTIEERQMLLAAPISEEASSIVA